MTIQAGVHNTHCCAKHGCKYGEDDTCTVVQGEHEGNDGCEFCADFMGFEPPEVEDDAWAAYEDSALFIHGDDRDGTDEL